MHKKLLLAMLVPILALSLIVVGCSSDDGPFDGSENYHRLQGVWYNLLPAGPASEIWFVLTGNQATVADGLGATGVATRTDFSFGIGDRYVSQTVFLNSVFAGIVTAANAIPADQPNRAAIHTLFTASDAFEDVAPATTPASIQRTPGDGTWAQLVLLEADRGNADEVAVSDIIRNAFATQFRGLGVTIHRILEDAVLFQEFVVGGTPTFFEAGDLGDLSPLGASFRLFGDVGDDRPVSLVPFRISFHTFRDGQEVGYISGFWVEFDRDNPTQGQSIVVTDQRILQVVENLLIPYVGSYSRNMPGT